MLAYHQGRRTGTLACPHNPRLTARPRDTGAALLAGAGLLACLVGERVQLLAGRADCECLRGR
jgi:hypothetical protein